MGYNGEERRKNLNGDTKVIVDLVLGAVDKVDKKVDGVVKKIDNLDCKAHAEVLNQFKDHVRDGRMWRGIVAGILVSLFGFAVAWGSLNTNVKNLSKQIEKLEKIHEK